MCFYLVINKELNNNNNNIIIIIIIVIIIIIIIIIFLLWSECRINIFCWLMPEKWL